MSEIEKPLAHKSCPKMLLYGIGVVGVGYVVWSKNATVGPNDSFCEKELLCEKGVFCTFLANGLSETKIPLPRNSSPKMLLYGIGVIGVGYVVWPEIAKIGIFWRKNLMVGLFSKTA